MVETELQFLCGLINTATQTQVIKFLPDGFDGGSDGKTFDFDARLAEMIGSYSLYDIFDACRGHFGEGLKPMIQRL